MKSREIGTYKGRKVYEWPVEVTLNKGFGGTLEDWTDPQREVWYVIAHRAADAADYVRKQFERRPETEITVYGPKGGKAARRFIGWYGAIGAELFEARREPQQLGVFA